MKVFISWSKEPSRAVASVLRNWLKDVIQSLEPWMSDQDIQGGDRWANTIGVQLEAQNVGILVLTAHNQYEPWINFEAGAISKLLGSESRVIPYLFNFKLAELSSGPLTQFHGREADKAGTLRMIQDINSFTEKPLDASQINRAFELHWPALEKSFEEIRLQAVALPNGKTGERSTDDKLDELVVLVRSLNRGIPDVVRSYLDSKEELHRHSLKSYYYTIRKILNSLDFVMEYTIDEKDFLVVAIVDDDRSDAEIEKDIKRALYPTTHGEFKVAVQNVRKHINKYGDQPPA